MKPLALHAAARAELRQAIAYYEGQRQGLGAELRVAFEEAALRIEQNPGRCACYRDTNYRKCALRRFPYTIYFLELDDCVWLAAVAHHKRKPDYWMGRDPLDG